MTYAKPHPYSPKEELANILTHAMGIGLSVLGLFYLIQKSLSQGEMVHLVSTAIFGISLLALYTISTLYHYVPSQKWKRVYRILDHSSIYLLIAGTYTPVTLVLLPGQWGMILFATVWGLSVIGISLKLFFTGRFEVFSTALYLFMGWLIVLAWNPLIEHLPTHGLYLLFAGGVTYSLGALIYLWQSLPFNHAIWHFFVLGGSILHYMTIFLYVIPD